MKIYEERISISPPATDKSQLLQLISCVGERIGANTEVVRLVVTRSTNAAWHLEVASIENQNESLEGRWRSVLTYRQRGPENESAVNVVLVVPTGIGAELGGHAGDAGAVARLFGCVADQVITHPNVVNGSDLNELPENGLYVEGSLLSRLLMGQIGLRPVRRNRVLTMLDDHPERPLVENAINSVGAARAVMGLECPIAVRLKKPLEMRSSYSESGRAAGEVVGLEHLLELADKHADEYDAIAITSRIQVPSSYHHEYYLGGLVNPWGGVEAMLTHTVSTLTGKPSAHSPMMESEEILNQNLGVVDPRMAAEVVSVTYLHCILKGLQRAPQVVWDAQYVGRPGTIWAEDVSAIVVPEGCIGLPTLAAMEQGIPVVSVRDNKNLLENDLSELPFNKGKLIEVDSYLEAAGVISAMRAGVSLESLARPLPQTRVEPELSKEKAKELGGLIKFGSH